MTGRDVPHVDNDGWVMTSPQDGQLEDVLWPSPISAGTGNENTGILIETVYEAASMAIESSEIVYGEMAKVVSVSLLMAEGQKRYYKVTLKLQMTDKLIGCFIMGNGVVVSPVIER